jgi:hypothetical protein
LTTTALTGVVVPRLNKDTVPDKSVTDDEKVRRDVTRTSRNAGP